MPESSWPCHRLTLCQPHILQDVGDSSYLGVSNGVATIWNTSPVITHDRNAVCVQGRGGGEGESDYKVKRDNLHTITISRATQRNAAGTIAYGQDNSASR